MSAEQVYQLLGRLATTFSALEYNITSMLERFMCGSVLDRPIILDRLSFRDTIDRCKKAARYRFNKRPARLDETLKLLRRVDRVRELRNHFIHGQWVIGDDYVSVMTFRLRYDQSSDLWEYLVDERMSIPKLRGVRLTVSCLLEDIQKFNQRLDKDCRRWSRAG